MAELLDVLSREKFAKRLTAAGVTPIGIVGEIRRLAIMASPADVPRVVASDPDDDHVLACAVASHATLIVSGDQHLLGLGGEYQDIRIVTPAEAVRLISP
jgi:predicted nucleic acid-binding protein